MKKILAILLSVSAMLCLFAGCGTKGDTDDKNSGKTWIIATDTVFKPFEYKDAEGNLVGIDVEILEAQKGTLFKKGFVRIRVHTDSPEHAPEFDGKIPSTKTFSDPIPQGEFENKLVEFVQTLIEKMGYSVKVSVIFREERKIGIKLDSENSSILIGRKGKNNYSSASLS